MRNSECLRIRSEVRWCLDIRLEQEVERKFKPSIG